MFLVLFQKSYLHKKCNVILPITVEVIPTNAYTNMITIYDNLL